MSDDDKNEQRTHGALLYFVDAACPTDRPTDRPTDGLLGLPTGQLVVGRSSLDRDNTDRPLRAFLVSFLPGGHFGSAKARHASFWALWQMRDAHPFDFLRS